MTTPVIINGNEVSATMATELKQRMEELKSKYADFEAGLGVILVGDRKDSATYVRMKRRRAEELGITVHFVQLPEDAAEADVISAVRDMNANDRIHGILVQLPLPAHMNEIRVLDSIREDKDVDGFHPINIGSIAIKGRTPHFVPCTAKGCIELLDRYNIPIEGKHAVVLGRSTTVGMPASLLLLERNATVTVCHSRTPNIAEMCRQADIVIAAVGRAQYVRRDWIKPGAVVIDVGINHIEDSTKKSGFRLVGDVAYEEVAQVASAITPVPGGVGPMTVIILMRAVIDGAARQAAATLSAPQ